MIYALSSPVGKSAVGIIRVSGEGVVGVVSRLLNKPLPEPNKMFLRELVGSAGLVDRLMVVFYRSPNSYTGEDMVELFCHGGLLVIKKISDLLEGAGLRVAEPGEFTHIACLNQKLTLNEAEMVDEIINASNERDLGLGLSAIGGVLSDRVFDLGEKISSARTYYEALIDFSDEDGVEDVGVGSEMLDSVLGCLGEIKNSIKVSSGITKKAPVLIMGPPNSGKSSIFNRLLGYKRALTAASEGTTRDLINSELVVGSVVFDLYDSAGIRKTDDGVEAEGIDFVKKKLPEFSFVLVVVDVNNREGLEDLLGLVGSIPYKVIINKSDLDGGLVPKKDELCVSAKTGFGFDELRGVLFDLLGDDGGGGDELYLVNSRQYDLVCRCEDHIKRALALSADESFDLVAEELKNGRGQLDYFLGRNIPDDLLGDIFRNFCVGK